MTSIGATLTATATFNFERDRQTDSSITHYYVVAQVRADRRVQCSLQRGNYARRDDPPRTRAVAVAGRARGLIELENSQSGLPVSPA